MSSEMTRAHNKTFGINSQALRAAPASIVPQWTDEELAQGRVGIRWVRDDGVFGRPSRDDVLAYIESRWPAQPAPAVPEPTGKAPCARHCEATAFQIEIRELKKCIADLQAQIVELHYYNP